MSIKQQYFNMYIRWRDMYCSDALASHIREKTKESKAGVEVARAEFDRIFAQCGEHWVN